MSLVVTTLPNAVAPAAHSAVQASTKAPSAQSSTTSQSLQNTASSQAAAIVSLSSDKTRPVSSRPNERVDATYSANKKDDKKSESTEKEQSNSEHKKVSFTA